jgi:hypothetical protein
MAGITLAQAQTALTAALAAYEKAVKAREYSHNGPQTEFSKQNQDIDKLTKSIDFWDNKVNELTSGNEGLIISQHAPLDD